jgi:acylpyruvate hydrolase
MNSHTDKTMTNNIWAVGRNYSDHAKEMKSEVPTEPFFFLKSGACLNFDKQILLPTWSNDVQHELEIAFLLDEKLTFSGFTLALDLTARDAQNRAKEKGLPWTLAKSFVGACPIGNWKDISKLPELNTLLLKLLKNGQTAQDGFAKDMLFKPERLLKDLKLRFPLQPMDILLTGTPAGVSKLTSGDHLEAILQSENETILTCQWDVL